MTNIGLFQETEYFEVGWQSDKSSLLLHSPLPWAEHNQSVSWYEC